MGLSAPGFQLGHVILLDKEMVSDSGAFFHMYGYSDGFGFQRVWGGRNFYAARGDICKQEVCLLEVGNVA